MALASIVLLSSLFFVSCKTNQNLVYSTIETVVVASEMNGTYVVRVQGKGTSKQMAYVNAQKQAVYDIIFKNIHTSYGDHKMLFAILNNPSIEQQEFSFFNNFFSDNGAYANYVGNTKEKGTRFSSSSTECVILNVVVKRAELIEYLINNNIVN